MSLCLSSTEFCVFVFAASSDDVYDLWSSIESDSEAFGVPQKLRSKNTSVRAAKARFH